jgi:hypothetical protein
MTAQDPDRIRYKRRVYALLDEPLEMYFTEELPKPNAFESCCTACWRGYLARWSIRRGKLYLDRISPWPGAVLEFPETEDDAYRRHMAEIFPDQSAPIFAHWFTGQLSLVSLKFMEYVHAPYASELDTKYSFQIESGMVIAVLSKNHEAL